VETASVEGVVCALTYFEYDMRGQGGPQGTSVSVWLVPDFGSEPVKIKVPDPAMQDLVADAGFGGGLYVEYALTANVKGTRAVIDRRATSVKKLTPAKVKQLLTAAA
jgi:hypothetical protein